MVSVAWYIRCMWIKKITSHVKWARAQCLKDHNLSLESYGIRPPPACACYTFHIKYLLDDKLKFSKSVDLN